MATRKAPTRKRRVRPRAATGSAPPVITKQAEDKLSVVRDLMVKREALAVELQNAEDELEKYMRSKELSAVTLKDIIAEIVTPMGRKTNVIRPKDFRKKVSDRDFMNCVTISITAAKEVLSGKELEAVCDTILPEKKPSILKIKTVKQPVMGKTKRKG